MGDFIDTETLKARSRLDSLREMDTEDIEDLLITPAERRLEEVFELDLNTDAVPRRFESAFEDKPHLLARFQKDMRSAVILLIDRMEQNPHGYKSQSVRGSSVTFGRSMPVEVSSLLGRWGTGGAKTGRLYRV